MHFKRERYTQVFTIVIHQNNCISLIRDLLLIFLLAKNIENKIYIQASTLKFSEFFVCSSFSSPPCNLWLEETFLGFSLHLSLSAFFFVFCVYFFHSGLVYIYEVYKLRSLLSNNNS